MSLAIRSLFLVCAALIVFDAGVSVRAQVDASDEPFFPGRRKEDPPRSIQESLSKMRIEKDKKDFNEMLQRGDDAAKIAGELKEDPTASQQEQLASIAKLVKKIHDELGADGSGDDKAALPANQAEAIRALKEQVAGLAEELKKINRFTVSASAIDRTNEILRLVKYLHG